MRADAALFGTVSRTGSDLIVRARLLEVKSAGADAIALEPLTIPADELLARLPGLVITYARTMKVSLTDAETARIEKAARPTTSLRAFELYARSQQASNRGGQEGNESAADLLSRAIEADPNFVVAQYSLGRVHKPWAIAGRRPPSIGPPPSSILRTPSRTRPWVTCCCRRPAACSIRPIEAYQKAIERRPFYADAHVGLGDASGGQGRRGRRHQCLPAGADLQLRQPAEST